MPFTPQRQKKKPPPRPPPPNFSKYKSKSTLNLNQPMESVNLIEWSPPNSPKPDHSKHFGGSVSSSYSSSTSSLASSKKSFEYELPLTNVWPLSNGGGSFQSYISPASTSQGGTRIVHNSVPLSRPTIIRPKIKPSDSPPMPNIPPPSPPKEVSDVTTPYGIAIYEYQGRHTSDLNFQIGDVVELIRRVNEDWLYGRIINREGMFPESFIDIQVPLKDEENIVTALYDFPAQTTGDLNLTCGQKVKVLRKITDEWLFGESANQTGQFPSNFVNRVPKNI